MVLGDNMKESQVIKILEHLDDQGLMISCKSSFKFVVDVDRLKESLLEVKI
jgi:hypothetical protein